MNISALLGCFSFYSALYLIYYFFAKTQHPFLIMAAIVLLIFCFLITPYRYEKRRQGYDSTMRFGDYLFYPLITWWRLFIYPIRFLLNIWFMH